MVMQQRLELFRAARQNDHFAKEWPAIKFDMEYEGDFV